MLSRLSNRMHFPVSYDNLIGQTVLLIYYKSCNKNFYLILYIFDFKVVYIVLLAGNIDVSIFTGGLFLTIWKKLMTSKFAQAMRRCFINRLLLIPIE